MENQSLVNDSPRHDFSITALFNWVSKSKHQVITTANQTQVNIKVNQWKIKVYTGKLLKTREIASDQVAVNFAFDWLKGLLKFSRPITQRGKAGSMQSRTTIDIQLSVCKPHPSVPSFILVTSCFILVFLVFLPTSKRVLQDWILSMVDSLRRWNDKISCI